jgi:hypothetical protein
VDSGWARCYNAGSPHICSGRPAPSTALIVRAQSAPISAQYRPDDQLDPARADRAGVIRAGHGDFRPTRSTRLIVRA